MNHLPWQELIVTAIVAAALLRFCSKHLPLGGRRALTALLLRCGLPRARVEGWLRTGGKTAAKGGCGDGCSSCGSCSTEPAPPLESAGKPVIKLHQQR